MKELWKPIKGYENLYQISNRGNIKHYSKRFGWRQRKKTDKSGWYFTVNLYDENQIRKTARIHRLVAEAFMGEIPKGYHVHHKDGNKQNNCVDNLEIVCPKDHVTKTIVENPRFLLGMINYNRYERPLKIAQFTLNGEFVAEYCNGKEASKHTGVCARNILQVANHKEGRKQAGGFVWKFVPREGVVS